MGDSANILDYPTLPDRMARSLLDEVRSLRRRTRKQSFPPSVEVRALDASGVPTGARSKNLLAAVRCRLDHALRVDLLVVGAAGLAQAPMAAVFVVRPGAVELTDGDLGWFRAWRIASDIVGVPAGPVWAIGRSGWLDVGANRATVLPRHRLRDRDRTASGASAPVAADRDAAGPGDRKEDPA